MRNQKGVTAIEYAIMLALVSLAIVTATPRIASGVTLVFAQTASALGFPAPAPEQKK